MGLFVRGHLEGLSSKATNNKLQIKRPLRIVDAWDYLNDVCFDGEMIRPTFKVWLNLQMVTKGKKYKLLGCYDKSPKEKKGIIWISYKHEDNSQLETLFHEMVHQYINEVLDDKNYHHHGTLFWDIYYERMERL